MKTILIPILISVLFLATFTLQVTKYPTEDKPTACAINSKITDTSTQEGIASICQTNAALENPLKVTGTYDKSNILVVENDKIPLFIPGCTYLEARKECVPDDSTSRCAKFNDMGCTHCWKKTKAKFKLPD
jgi:hypothetical protein